MATKVKITNFQSIEKADLVIDGFTVITGKNNSGKSAVQRAIRGVFQNAKGNSFVRYGASHCEVSVEFEDGNSVLWQKGKKENKYIINGKEFDKVGSGTPETLDAFEVQPITAGGREIWSQFAPQFTGQVFLLNETGSVLAEAISDVERVQTLNKAMKQSERDKRSCNSTLKVRRKDEKAVQTDLEQYKGLDTLGLLIDTIESIEAKIDKITQATEKLNAYLDKRDSLTALITQLDGITAITIPNTDKVEDLSEQLVSLLDLDEQYMRATRLVLSLQGVSEVFLPDFSDVERIQTMSDYLTDLYKRRERALSGTRIMTEMCSELSDHMVLLDKTDFLQKTHNSLELLEDLQRERDISVEQIEDLENAVQQNKRDQVALQRHLKEHIHSEGSCPLCGSTVC